MDFDLEAPSWHATTFTKNRQRLLDGDIAAQCLARTVAMVVQAPSRLQGLALALFSFAAANWQFKRIRPAIDIIVEFDDAEACVIQVVKASASNRSSTSCRGTMSTSSRTLEGERSCGISDRPAAVLALSAIHGR